MGYFLNHLLRDKLVWGLVAVIVIGTINVADILSYSFAFPGFFNLWAVRMTAIVAAAGATGFGIFLYRQGKHQKRFACEWPVFIAARREVIAERLAADPKFQTHCFQCRHFDQQRLDCGLWLPRLTIWIKFDSDSPYTHCLLWNASDLPLTPRRGDSD